MINGKIAHFFVKHILSFARFATVAAVVLIGSVAEAATFSVINTNDSGTGSLNQAVMDANNTPGDDVITFNIPGAGPHLIGLSSGLAITSNLSIINDASGDEAVTVRKNDNTPSQFEIFRLNPALTVLISGLTISNGVGGSQGGGAIHNPGSTLTLRNCTLSNNQTSHSGGAILNFGTNSPARLTMINCTMSGNISGTEGGAIRNLTVGASISEITLVNCTFSGHTSGVIAIEKNLQGGVAKVSLTNCTFANNRSVNSSKASSISNSDGTVEMANTIFARASGAAANFMTIAAGTFTSLGHNLADDAAGGDGGTAPGGFLNAPGDIRNSEPQLAALANNGGLTWTHALLAGSPAVDSGDDTRAPAQDQRDLFRSGVSDIGSFESGGTATPGASPTPSPTPNPSATPTPTPTPPPPLLVTNTNNSGAGSLREVITAANTNSGDDTIRFTLPGDGPHVINLLSPLPPLASNVAIVNDQSGDEAVTVHRYNTTRFSIFVTTPGTTVVIAGLTISNGNLRDAFPEDSGGGIRNDHANLTLRNCTFSANEAAGNGGAIHNNGTGSGSASLTILNCAFSSNSAGFAGAILNDGSQGGMATLTAVRCAFTGNSSFGGGAVANQAGNAGNATATISDSTFSANSGGLVNNGTGTGEATLLVQRCLVTNHSGPGMMNGRTGPDAVATLNITDSTIANNALGGIRNNWTLNMMRSTVSGNSANEGGGIHNDWNATLVNCTLSGNTATSGTGSAIRNTGLSGKLVLLNCTLKSDAGTNLDNFFGIAEVTNTVFQRGTGANIANNSGTITSKGHNLSDDAAGGNGATGPGGFLNGPGDIRNTNPQLGPLASNGGNTQTHALMAGSPAINAADNGLAPARDQRNYVRPDVADIGAYEYNGTIPVTLANISTRLPVQTGDNVLIGGFIITGTQPKTVILRAIGPSLTLPGKLDDPTMELYNGSQLVASNDNWMDAPNRQAITDSAVAPTNNLESAILTSLNPGDYTAIIRGANSGTGIGVVEAYDLDRTVDSKLANIATRGVVQTGDNILIGGFIVLGPDPQKVIIRALGPSLAVPGNLADPTLELRDGNGALLEANNNWMESTNKQAILDSTIAPTNDLESAIVRTLSPGNHTAIVRGVNNSTGIAVVEVYSLN